MAYPAALDSFSTKTDNVTTVAAADINDLGTAIVNIETAMGYGATAPVSTATNSTIVKRDSSAGAAFAIVTATAINATGQIKSTSNTGGSTSGVHVDAAIPGMALQVTGAAADNKWWDWVGLSASTKVQHRAVNDANSVAGVYLEATRSGTTISDVTLTGTTITMTGAPTVSGATVLSSTLGVTGAATLSSTLAVTGVTTATGGVAVPRSSGTAVFAVDGGATGSQITIANNGTATPFGNSNNFAGLILIKETATDGHGALFFTVGHFTILLSDPASLYSNTATTASKTNVYLSGGFAVTIENKRGGSRTYSVVAVRLDTAN